MNIFHSWKNVCPVKRKVFDLADVALGWKKKFPLIQWERRAYYKSHYGLTSNEVLLQNEYLKSGRKKILSWFAYSKKLKRGFCRTCIVSVDNKTCTYRGSFIKNTFQNLDKLTWKYQISWKIMRRRKIIFKGFWRLNSSSTSWQKNWIIAKNMMSNFGKWFSWQISNA